MIERSSIGGRAGSIRDIPGYFFWDMARTAAMIDDAS